MFYEFKCILWLFDTWVRCRKIKKLPTENTVFLLLGYLFILHFNLLKMDSEFRFLECMSDLNNICSILYVYFAAKLENWPCNNYVCNLNWVAIRLWPTIISINFYQYLLNALMFISTPLNHHHHHWINNATPVSITSWSF